MVEPVLRRAKTIPVHALKPIPGRTVRRTVSRCAERENIPVHTSIPTAERTLKRTESHSKMKFVHLLTQALSILPILKHVYTEKC